MDGGRKEGRKRGYDIGAYHVGKVQVLILFITYLSSFGYEISGFVMLGGVVEEVLIRKTNVR